MTRTGLLLLVPATRALLVAIAWTMMTAAAAGQGVVRVPRDVAVPLPPQAGSGAIVGRVIAADSGAPIRRAEVTASHPMNGPRTVVTDDDGRFAFNDLANGPWQVSAAKAGFVTQQFGQRRPFGAARRIVLNGERAVAEIALTRASAINGRVYDENGEPLAAVRVNIMRSRMVQRSRRLEPIGEGDLTDDTGAFRLFGLPPGEYYVSASLRVAPIDSVIETTYAPTYYPGAGNFAEAQRVTLAPGAEASVDFPLLPFRTARISGTVVDAAGGPGDAFLSLTSNAGELGVPLGVGGVTRPDGSFTLPDVPPGAYTLNATIRSDNSPMAETTAFPLAVYGDDLTGLTVMTSRPATIRGTIVADTGVRKRLPEQIEVSARSTHNPGEATFTQSERNRFDLIVPPGPVRLRIDAPEGWDVKAVDMNGVSALDAIVDLRGEQDMPVRIVLTDRVTEVTGNVTGAADDVTPNVVLFPEDLARLADSSRHLRTVAAARGSFRVVGLPPGERYRAIAIEDLEDGEGDDPDFLMRIREQAIPFTLGEAEKLMLDLKVVQR
jgi:hypothetical protein